MSNSRLLHGKTALVTGANRGIGAAIVERFAQEGADIVACARKPSPTFADHLARLAATAQTTIMPLYFDLRDEAATKAALKEVTGGRRIDILVNNAGVAHGGFLQMTPIAKIREIYESNLFAQLVVTQAVVRVMTRQKTGTIINMVSVAGLDANPGNCAYGASKAAFAYTTKTLAKELAPYGIRVNAVAPGLTQTTMADQMEDNARAEMVAASAMRRLATPIEIANTVVFLASDLASFTTGQILRVDGGM